MEMMNEQSETACFDIDGVRYRYLYMKEDNPARGRRRTPVLFVHGFAQNALSWFPASRTIFLERDVYGIDLVGHGGSSVPVHPAPYSLPGNGRGAPCPYQADSGKTPGRGLFDGWARSAFRIA